MFDNLGQRDVIAVGDLPIGYALGGLREGPADLLDVAAPRMNQSPDVNQPEPLFRLPLRTAFAGHRRDDLVSDARRGRTRAEHHYPLIAQTLAVDFYRRQQPCQRDRARPLNVVVETAQAVLITFEQSPGVVAREIFTLEQRAGESFGHSLNELFDAIVVHTLVHSLAYRDV